MSESWKTHAIVLASFLLGIVSVILSFWQLEHFGLAFTRALTGDPNQPWFHSWRALVFEHTRGGLLVVVEIGLPGVAGLAGLVGYFLVRRTSRENRRSFAAIAARLSLGGLVGVGLNVLLLVWMLGYRAYRYLLG